jgi:hypothetical protein
MFRTIDLQLGGQAFEQGFKKMLALAQVVVIY